MEKDVMTVADSAVLVTGANRGIGQALVQEALNRGARRVDAGTRQPLAHPDGRITPLRLDVTNQAQIQAAAGQSPTRHEQGRDTVQLGHDQNPVGQAVVRYRTDSSPASRLAAMTSARTAAALAATLGLAAAGWVVVVWQMQGMDMGVATRLGSFATFLGLWVAMMAAMMLPGAAPAVVRRAHASGRVRAVPLFVGSYLAVWTLVGVAIYAVYRPHGSLAAGAVAIAAGLYEFTPLKQRFRRRCRQGVGSGFQFGRSCVGSGIGLMLLLVALGVMSVTWMSVIAVLVLAQKLLPANAAVDVPLALAIVGLGILIVMAPWSVPGLMPPM
jgi:predicted metal-binding membrane protein